MAALGVDKHYHGMREGSMQRRNTSVWLALRSLSMLMHAPEYSSGMSMSTWWWNMAHIVSTPTREHSDWSKPTDKETRWHRPTRQSPRKVREGHF